MRAKSAISRKTEEQSIIGLFFEGLILCGTSGGAFSSGGREVFFALYSIRIALKRTFSIYGRT